MRDAVVMWRKTRMVVLVALSAAIYAAILIPFKAIPVIPGITELRPANAVPVVCAFLFGPAAAWGCAMGNLIGDFFGTLGPGSLFGLVGNFLLAYLPYRVWVAFRGSSAPTGGVGDIPVMVLGIFIGSAACGVVIGFGVDLLGIAPYMIVTTIITLNNFIIGLILGLPLISLMYPRARRWHLTYTQIMNERDYGRWVGAPLAVAAVLVMSLAGVLAAFDQRGLLARAGQLLGLLPVSAEPSALFVPAEMALREFGGWCSAAIVVASVFSARLWWRRGAAREEAGEAARAEREEAISVENLRFTYPDTAHPALDGVAFSQERGTTRFLMGRTGAGKSTLGLCLNGVIPNLQPGEYSGSVAVCGVNPARWPLNQMSEYIGLVFQDFQSQLFCSNVDLEVAFSLENRGVDRQIMRKRVDRWLQELDIAHLRDRDPATLSGGQKQRVALAAVMASEPDVIVLDEATTDLDPPGTDDVFEACERLTGDGRTLLIASHEAERAVDANSLLALADGRVAYEGSPRALLDDPQRCRKIGVGVNPLAEIAEALDLRDIPASVEEAEKTLRELDARLDVERFEKATGQERDTSAPVIEMEDVNFAYGDLQALRDVTLTVPDGDFLAVLGANGSGKTTMCKMLIGLLRPDSGSVRINGTDIRDHPISEIATEVGYLYQNPDSQIFADTVRAEVAFGPRNMGLEDSVIQERVSEALATIELEGYEDSDPFSLTRGERQRVALASILASDPSIIVFDEPTTGLDLPQQQAMFQLLQKLSDGGRTILMITHHLQMAVQHARRLVFMRDGRISASGPTRSLLAQEHEMIDELYGARTSILPPSVILSVRVFGKALTSPSEWADFVQIPAEE